MYTEPSVPFYMVLSVYVPLVLVAYLAVFLALSAVAGGLSGLVSVFQRNGRDDRGTRGLRLHLEPGKA